jgi:hypothetical protein
MWNKKIRVLEPFKSRGLTDNLNYQFVGLTIVPALDVDRGNPLGDYFLPVPCEQKWPLPSELTCEFIRLTNIPASGVDEEYSCITILPANSPHR